MLEQVLDYVENHYRGEELHDYFFVDIDEYMEINNNFEFYKDMSLHKFSTHGKAKNRIDPIKYVNLFSEIEDIDSTDIFIIKGNFYDDADNLQFEISYIFICYRFFPLY